MCYYGGGGGGAEKLFFRWVEGMEGIPQVSTSLHDCAIVRETDQLKSWS